MSYDSFSNNRCVLVALPNVQSYTEHAPQQNDDATGQKCPLSHMTQTEGGTLALQLEKDDSKGGMFDTENMYMSFECSEGLALICFDHGGYNKALPFFIFCSAGRFLVLS